jgi:predicted transcriptional regulator
MQLYVFLAQHGPQKKEQMESQFGFDAKELTACLNALKKKGLVEVKPDRSSTFSIVPFDIVLQRLIDTKKEQISSIKREIQPS